MDLRPYFASCRLLTTYHVPDQFQNAWTHPDRRLHRAVGRLAHAMAQAEALPVTQALR